MVTNEEYERAVERAREQEAKVPKAVSAKYDRRIGRVVIALSSGLELAFSPRNAQGLEEARPSQLEVIEITPSGYGLHFPELDADFSIPGLMEGFFGSRKWMAARLGAAGGRATTKKKVTAARRNGKLGGRPKKAVAG